MKEDRLAFSTVLHHIRESDGGLLLQAKQCFHPERHSLGGLDFVETVY